VASVRDNPEQERYELFVDDRLAGMAQYRRRKDLIAFVHTEIAEDLEGQGLASVLIGHALDDARAQGLAVLPFCPFVRGYIERHEDYLDLVPPDSRDTFDLTPAAG
jgi:hypothetical protein